MFYLYSLKYCVHTLGNDSNGWISTSKRETGVRSNEVQIKYHFKNLVAPMVAAILFLLELIIRNNVKLCRRHVVG